MDLGLVREPVTQRQPDRSGRLGAGVREPVEEVLLTAGPVARANFPVHGKIWVVAMNVDVESQGVAAPELLKPHAALMVAHPPSEGVDIDRGMGRGLWCWLRRRLHLEACGRWCSGRRLANLALGRRARRCSYRQQERSRSPVERPVHAVNKSRQIVNELALSIQPSSRQLLAGARIIVSHLFAPF